MANTSHRRIGRPKLPPEVAGPFKDDSIRLSVDAYALPLVSQGNVAEAKEDSCVLGLDEGTDEENRKPLGEDEKVAGNSRSKSSRK